MKTKNSSSTSRHIKASAEKIFTAITDPALLVKWQVPGDMTARLHHYDLREGGGYEMSLFYPPGDSKAHGKTNDKEDRFAAKFIEIVAAKKIVESIRFQSEDPLFQGEVVLEILLTPDINGTAVTFNFTNIPPGIDPKDNDAGTKSSLEKLAHLVESH